MNVLEKESGGKSALQNFLKSYDTTVWVRFLGQIITSVGNFMLGPFITLYMVKELHISILTTMAVLSISPLISIVVGFLAGPLSDRVGRKPLMWISLLGQGVAMLFFSMARLPWEIALITVLDGMAGSLYWPAANAQIADVVPEERRGEVFSLLHMGLNIGAAVGPLIGALFFQVDPHLLFIISASGTFLACLLIFLLIPETLAKSVRLEQKEKIRHKEHVAKQHRCVRFQFNMLREYLPVIWLMLLSLPVTLLYAQVKSNFPLYLSTRFADYTHIYALMMTFNGTMVIILQMIIARLARNRPLWVMIGFSYLAFCLVGFGYAFAPSLGFLLVTEFVFTLGEMVGLPQMQHIVGLFAPKDKRGSYFAVYGLRYSLSETAGPLLGAYVMRKAGGRVLFMSIGILIAVSGLILVTVLQRLKHKAFEQPAVEATV